MMKWAREHRWALLWGIYCTVLISLLLPFHYPICDASKNADHENCPTYQVAIYLVIECGMFLDAHAGSIAALAGLAVAWFTYTLWQSTDKLWKAGELQRKEARKALLIEIAANRTAFAYSQKALKAAQEANEITRAMGRAQNRAYLTIKGIWLETYAFNARIEVEIVNAGLTPVRWVETEGNAQIITDQTKKSSDVPLNPAGPLKDRWSIDPGREGQKFPCFTDALNGRELLQMVCAARGKSFLSIQGTVRWETVFGEVFESTFFAWDVPKGFGEPEKIGMPSGVKTVSCRQVSGIDTTKPSQPEDNYTN